MTSFGMQIGWLALQTTVLAAIAAAIVAWTARRDARATVVVIAGTLTILLVVTVAGFCPLHRLLCWSPFPAVPPQSEFAADDPTVGSDTAGHGWGISLSAVWGLLRELSEHAPEPSAPRSGWVIVAALYVVGATLAGARLLIGWLAIRALRRASRLLTDDALREVADRLGAPDRLELRECDEPGLAATIGWWRPVILLPPEWRSWSADELRAVLAHELAHVRHHDYLTGLLARLAEALHFYHPLVRWLSNQLRWQQEVAADAAAAAAAGGCGLYRVTLARLALRAPARTPARLVPAMTGGTLLRRIRIVFFFALKLEEEERAFVELIRKVPAARRRDWGTGLKQVDRAPFATVFDNHDQHYTKLFAKDVEPADLEALKEVRFAALGIELGDGRPVRLIVDATSVAAAPRLEEASNAYARLAEEALRREGEPKDALERLMQKLSTELLQSRRLQRDGARLEWTAHSTVRVGHIVGAQLALKK